MLDIFFPVSQVIVVFVIHDEFIHQRIFFWFSMKNNFVSSDGLMYLYVTDTVYVLSVPFKFSSMLWLLRYY